MIIFHMWMGAKLMGLILDAHLETVNCKSECSQSIRLIKNDVFDIYAFFLYKEILKGLNLNMPLVFFFFFLFKDYP